MIFQREIAIHPYSLVMVATERGSGSSEGTKDGAAPDEME